MKTSRHLGCVGALLREREDGRARCEALSEVVQFRRDFRIFYSERHRCDLDLKPGYRNSNGYHLNTIDQLAHSSHQFQGRINSGTELWASTMRTELFWSGSGSSAATTVITTRPLGLTTAGGGLSETASSGGSVGTMHS